MSTTNMMKNIQLWKTSEYMNLAETTFAKTIHATKKVD